MSLISNHRILWQKGSGSLLDSFPKCTCGLANIFLFRAPAVLVSAAHSWWNCLNLYLATESQQTWICYQKHPSCKQCGQGAINCSWFCLLNGRHMRMKSRWHDGPWKAVWYFDYGQSFRIIKKLRWRLPNISNSLFQDLLYPKHVNSALTGITHRQWIYLHHSYIFIASHISSNHQQLHMFIRIFNLV